MKAFRLILAVVILFIGCRHRQRITNDDEESRGSSKWSNILNSAAGIRAPTQGNCVILNNRMEDLGKKPKVVCPPSGDNRGCCSWHGGLGECNIYGRWTCADGWTSSCDCP